MSAIGMILTASLVAVGAVALVRRLQRYAARRDQKAESGSARHTIVLDFKKNPQTDVFERTD